MTSPTSTAEAGPDHPGDLRAGLRTGAVILTLALVTVAGIVWTAHPPGSGSGRADRTIEQVQVSTDGRLGAAPPLADTHQDQGNPVPLSDGSTLWLFADTSHQGAPHFWHTSTAAVTRPGSTRMTFLTDPAGEPIEFLARTPAERARQHVGDYVPIWPTGGTLLPDGRVIVSYAKWHVIRKPLSYEFLGAGLFEYRYPGLATTGRPATRIADGLWGPDDGPVGSPVYADGYVFFTMCQDLECFALRTSPDRLTDRSSYSWRTATGWSPQARDRRPVPFVAGRPGRNPAVARLASGVWAMTDTTAGATSGHGQLWVSRTPYGPWSAPLTFALPGCVDEQCYAVILHPQQSTDTRLRIGYVPFDETQYVHLVEVPIQLKDVWGAPTVHPG